MVLVLRDENRNVTNVYGYVTTGDIAKYAKEKHPDKSQKWEVNVPSDFIGEVEYLPEDDV